MPTRRPIALALTVLFALIFSTTASASSAKLHVQTTFEKGTFLNINLGKSQSKKTVIVEVGTQVKKSKTWKYSRLSQAKTSATGSVQVCSSKLLTKSSRVRVRVGSKVHATISITQPVQLSGCSYAPPNPSVAPVAVDTPVPTTTTTTVPPMTYPPSTTVAPTTTTVAPTTTTVAPTTTTTVPQGTAAPTSLSLTTATDTGDSSSDGITKATTVVIQGSAAPNASIQTFVNGSVSGSGCTADGSGQFECTLGTIAEGSHAVTAKATVNSLESVSSSAYNIVVDRTAPTTSVAVEDQWLNSNESTTVTFTTSETTTTLTSSDVTLYCTLVGGCSVSNFSGSGRTYSLTFNMINNMANGGAVAVPSGSYTDAAGNAVSNSRSATIMYDDAGPSAYISRSGDYLTLTFNEAPSNFSRSRIQLVQMYNGYEIAVYQGTQVVSGLESVGPTGQVWRFIVSNNMYGGDFYVRLSGVNDVDGNQATQQDLNIPGG